MPKNSTHTFPIGDVHGCAGLLGELLGEIELKAQKHGLDYRVVFLGDIIDRGPDSRRAMDLVIATLRDLPGSKLILGNHVDEISRGTAPTPPRSSECPCLDHVVGGSSTF